ncbi:hypothetical protein [Microcoleus sp. bin38.metabat.b11b12b14.051]|uniref:hypothetical protein n=1 Tax=Microcoleus sp. bin38.metabat.b11b12b14.051 TaxID=2742709 RepID=UPI0025F27A5D|nr:hypothetical protein [Microcoleus sp. bin38.metabat.b11b12b14.051]
MSAAKLNYVGCVSREISQSTVKIFSPLTHPTITDRARLWKNLWKICPDHVKNFTLSPTTIFAATSAGDRLLPAFPQVFHRIYQLQLNPSKHQFYFSTVSTGRSSKNTSIN